VGFGGHDQGKRAVNGSVSRALGRWYAVLSPELFLVLTRDRAWPPDKWERWAYGTLRSQLLAENGR
jgi:hypothetical protein